MLPHARRRLFGYQYAVEIILLPVKRLPDIVAVQNVEVTNLIEKKTAVAIKDKSVTFKPSTKYSRPVGLKEKSSRHSLM